MRETRFFGWACVAVTVSALLSTTAQGAAVVNWGGTEYVTGNKAFNDGNPSSYGTAGDWDGDGVANDRGIRHAFDEITPLSPVSGYTTLAGKSGTFYGGYDVARIGSNSSWNFTTNKSVFQKPAGDQIGYEMTPGFGYAHFVVAFLKPDFLNGGSANTNYLDADDTSISINLPTLENMTGRFMIKNGQQWYVSETTITAPGLATLANPSENSRWAIYNPVSALDFNAPSATFANLNLNDVQGVGYYFENDNVVLVTPKCWISEMAVNANFERAAAPPPVGAVPLPAAVWAGLGLMGAVAGRRALRRGR